VHHLKRVIAANHSCLVTLARYDGMGSSGQTTSAFSLSRDQEYRQRCAGRNPANTVASNVNMRHSDNSLTRPNCALKRLRRCTTSLIITINWTTQGRLQSDWMGGGVSQIKIKLSSLGTVAPPPTVKSSLQRRPVKRLSCIPVRTSESKSQRRCLDVYVFISNFVAKTNLTR
jgi:hypothetical protein